MSYEPGLYTKGDSTKVAATPADAVALSFDGYVRAADAPSAVEDVPAGTELGEPGDDPESDPDQPQGEPVDAPPQPGQARSFDF